MEFTFNGVIPNDIYFNNNALNRVTCNGVTVWEKQQPGYEGLKFTSTGNSTIAMTTQGTAPDMKYSLDGGVTWVQWNFSTISLTDGQTVCFKGNNPSQFNVENSRTNIFVMTGSLAADGDIMSLIDDGACTTRTIPNDGGCFVKLFNNCTALTSVPKLTATTLKTICYNSMFSGCTGLTSLPSDFVIPQAQYYGCYGMFNGCTNLVSVPSGMLPGTSLQRGCYEHMFDGCTKLTSAPYLPATNGEIYCYQYMFRNCSSLRYIKCLLSNPSTSFSGTTYNWVSGVAASGTFIKNSSTTSWPSGANGIPSGWTVQNA